MLLQLLIQYGLCNGWILVLNTFQQATLLLHLDWFCCQTSVLDSFPVLVYNEVYRGSIHLLVFEMNFDYPFHNVLELQMSVLNNKLLDCEIVLLGWFYWESNRTHHQYKNLISPCIWYVERKWNFTEHARSQCFC